MKDESDKKMRSEYDFSDGVRGRHFKAYRAGHDEEAAGKRDDFTPPEEEPHPCQENG